MAHENLEKFAAIYCEAARDKEKYNDYMKNYMASRYRRVRDLLMKELGGKCCHCGSKDKLHIDHKDSKKKTFRAADVHSVSDKKLTKEKKNFQLLCSDCHKKKTHKEWDYSTPKPTHGTYWNYRKHECRCDKCKTAYKGKMKEWREMSKAKRLEEQKEMEKMIKNDK